MAEATRVAILGSGMAGATAARQLAQVGGCQVTVFEAGHGKGGRMSTRITRDDNKFQFDHGAQYMSHPKTSEFSEAVHEWIEAGVVQDWQGIFGVGSKDGSVSREDEASSTYRHKPHYVGYPTMNNICNHLLEHEKIKVVLQTRAVSSYDETKNEWNLKAHTDDQDLGTFDYLVASDRVSCTFFGDLQDAPVTDFVKHAKTIQSVPILTLMVAFDESLHVPFDGIRFEEGGAFGSLGWIAKDSSKPGRSRTDGKECWVIQSGPESARKVMDNVEGTSFEDKRQKVRDKAKNTLMADFLKALPILSGKESTADPTKIAYSVGHRWSAAFPNTPTTENNSLSYPEHNFFACGDYIGQYLGRIEGAYLSGKSAATALLESLEQPQ